MYKRQASNYPSFDQNLYATNYSEYSADPSLPLFNRALQGLYTPGSTFKPVSYTHLQSYYNMNDL